MLALSLLSQLALASPGSSVLGLEDWTPLDGHPLFADPFQFGGFPPGTLLGLDGCPQDVTLAVCDDDRFWETTCGAKALMRSTTSAACRTRFQTYAEARDGGLSTGQAIDPGTGQSEPVLFSDYVPDRITWAGFDTSYDGHLLALAEPRNPAEALGTALQVVWWDQNCSVQSCEEFAHEAFDDYSTFELAINQAVRAGDYRAVFDAAYGSDGIARRPLYASSGETLPPFSPAQSRSSYASGFQSFFDGTERVSGRGELYGFTLSETPQLQGTPLIIAGHEGDAVAIPFLARAMGDHPTPLPGEADGDDAVLAAWLTAFDDACDIDDTSGLLVCATSDADMLAVADAFSARLWDWSATPMAFIPADEAWPTPGTDPWDLHQDLSAALTSHDDALLVWLEERMVEFNRLRGERDEAWERLNALGLSASLQAVTDCETLPLACPDAATEGPEVLERLLEVDQRMATLVNVFDQAGCLAAAPTACDWSPRWFTQAVTGQYVQAREEAYRTCLQRTGNDFRALRREPDQPTFWLEDEETALTSFVGPICTTTATREAGERCVVTDDYLDDDASVRAYFDTLDAWGQAFAERWDFPVDPETGRPSIAGTSSDRTTIGDDRFGVELSYDAGWSLGALDTLPDDLSLATHGQLQVRTRLFGLAIPTPYDGTESEIDDAALFETSFDTRRETGNLAFVDLYAGNANGGDAWAVFDLLGTEVYRSVGGTSNPGVDGPLSYHFVANPDSGRGDGPDFAVSQQLAGANSTVFVGPIPLDLSVGAAGTVGLTANVQLHALGGETSGQVVAASIFEPSASASVFASATAGIPGFVAAGVDADLTLVEVALPVVTTLDAEVTATTARLDVQLDANLDTTLLAGRVRGFVETPWDDYSSTLFRYDGIQVRTPLADTSFNADLEAMQRAFGLAPGDAPVPTRDTPLTSLLTEDRGVCSPANTSPTPDLYVDCDDANVVAGILSAEVGTASFDLTADLTGLAGVHGQAVTPLTSAMAAPSSVLGLLGDHTLSIWYATDRNGDLLTYGGTSATGVRVERLPDTLEVHLPCEAGPRTLTLPAENDAVWQHLYLRYQDGTSQVDVGVADAARSTSCALDLPTDTLTLGADHRFDELGIWASALPAGSRARIRSQGEAELPLSGGGSAPLTSVTELSGALTFDGGTDLMLTWTNPPSLTDPGFGYDEVVVRIDPAGPVEAIDGGIDGYTGTNGSVTLFPPFGSDVVYVSTWARGPAGQRRGMSSVFRLPSADLPPVEGLLGHALDGATRLTWTLPDDPRIASVQVATGPGPLLQPSDGAVIYGGRGEAVDHQGLPNDVPVTYTVWTADGDGRRSEPSSLVVTPNTGSTLDSIPPGAVTDLIGLGSPDRVMLGWTLPPDVDPLRTRVERIDRGSFRRTLATLAGTRFVDTAVQADADYTYVLSVLDPSGNLGPVAQTTVTTGEVAPVELFSAQVVGSEVLFEAELPAVAVGSWTVIRTEGHVAADPLDGVTVCEAPLDGSCSDGSPPLDTPVRYTAFVVADGLFSTPVASEWLEVESAVGPAGPNRTVFVGERVELSTGLDNPVWSGVPDLVTDATGTWFVPRVPGSRTLTVQGTEAGSPATDSLTLSAVTWSRPVDAVTDNPFAGDLLANEGVQGLWSRPNDVLAWLGDGDIVAVTDTTVELVHEDCPEVVETDGALLLCRRGAFLDGVDLATGVVAWSAPAPAGTWVGDLSGGVVAYVNTPLPSQSAVQLLSATPSSFVALGSVELDAPTGFPADLVLDDDGGRLAVASFNAVTTFSLDTFSGALAPDDTLDVLDFGTVGIAWHDERLAVTVQNGTAEPDRLRIYDTEVQPPTLLTDVAAVPELVGVRYDDGFVARGRFSTAVFDADGTPQGTYTAPSWETGPVAIRDDEVWVAASPGGGLGGDRVLVHPRDTPRASNEPNVVFDPLSSGFSAVEALVTGSSHWAAKGFDQLVVGDAGGVLYQDSIGFSTAPFELTSLLCIDGGAVHYVADDGGVPSLLSAPLVATGLNPQTSWPLPATCDAGACSEDGLVLRCADELALYALDGTLQDTAPIPAAVAGAVLLRSGDGVLLSASDGLDEVVSGVWPELDTLQVSPSTSLATSSAGGALVEDVLTLPGSTAIAIDLSDGVSTPLPWEDVEQFDFDRATGQLTALRGDTVVGGDTSGWVSGVVVPPAFSLISEDAASLIDTGTGLVMTSIAPLAVSSSHHAVVAGSPLVTEVTWSGQPTLGLALQCRATSGPCEVLSFNPFTQSATIGWNAGSVPGEHSLTVFAGTHRWFTSGIDRIVVSEVL